MWCNSVVDTYDAVMQLSQSTLAALLQPSKAVVTLEGYAVRVPEKQKDGQASAETNKQSKFKTTKTKELCSGIQ